jgi:transcription elongation factor Elf1
MASSTVPSPTKKLPSGLLITTIHCPKCGSDSHSLAIVEAGEYLQTTCNCCEFSLMFEIRLADGEFMRSGA